jgi:antitoxin ParD1/3/4
MATMNVSLPDEMKEWVEKQSASGTFANTSDYVRDLIRRDIVRTQGVARLQAEIDKGRAGPFREFNPDELFEEITGKASASIRKPNAA